MKNAFDALGLGPERKVTDHGHGIYSLTITPLEHSGYKPSKIFLTSDQYRRYNLWGTRIALLREALPDLPSWQREIILTGFYEPKEGD